MALAINTPRGYELGETGTNELPIKAAVHVFEGSGCSINAGFVGPLVAAEPFSGFAEHGFDNTAGAAGARNIRLRSRGRVKANVVGVTGITNVGTAVYMSDDNTFTLTGAGNTLIGKVWRHIAATHCIVDFKADYVA